MCNVILNRTCTVKPRCFYCLVTNEIYVTLGELIKCTMINLNLNLIWKMISRSPYSITLTTKTHGNITLWRQDVKVNMIGGW